MATKPIPAVMLRSKSGARLSALIESVGRTDDQIKVGGRRIELGEIDAALTALPGVAAAAAAVQSTESGGRVLVGYLVPRTDFDVPRARVLLAERLPAARRSATAPSSATPGSSARTAWCRPRG